MSAIKVEVTASGSCDPRQCPERYAVCGRTCGEHVRGETGCCERFEDESELAAAIDAEIAVHFGSKCGEGCLYCKLESMLCELELSDDDE